MCLRVCVKSLAQFLVRWYTRDHGCRSRWRSASPHLPAEMKSTHPCWTWWGEEVQKKRTARCPRRGGKDEEMKVSRTRTTGSRGQKTRRTTSLSAQRKHARTYKRTISEVEAESRGERERSEIRRRHLFMHSCVPPPPLREHANIDSLPLLPTLQVTFATHLTTTAFLHTRLGRLGRQKSESTCGDRSEVPSCSVADQKNDEGRIHAQNREKDIFGTW